MPQRAKIEKKRCTKIAGAYVRVPLIEKVEFQEGKRRFDLDILDSTLIFITLVTTNILTHIPITISAVKS